MRAIDVYTYLLSDLLGAQDDDFLARESDVLVSDGGVRFGVGRNSFHLLVPIPAHYTFSPQEDRRLALRERPGEPRWMDLVCSDRHLEEVFGMLVDDLLQRLARQPEAAAPTVLEALDEWRELFARAEQLSEEVARGLFGELLVLKRLALVNAYAAIDSWRGPEGDVHDFVTGHADLEVKAAASSGTTVEISSLRQLDEVDGAALHLLRLTVPSSSNGQSISELVDELAVLGCPSNELHRKLAAAGWVAGVVTDDHRFSAEDDLQAWRVTPDFPGLRSADLPEERRQAITRVKYVVDLLNAPGALAPAELDDVFASMMSHHG